MEVKRILTRIYVNKIDPAIDFYENLLNEKCSSRFKYSQVGLELASVGDILIIAGSDEVLKPFKNTTATLLVDSIDSFKKFLLRENATIIKDVQQVPTGLNMTVQHNDGTIVEYVEHRDNNDLGLKIRPAANADLKEIMALLSANKLPTIDLMENSVQLFAGSVNNELIGSIGIEKYKQIGLLRSLAVKDELKNRKIGEKLINFLVEFCIGERITELYLLTTTAEKYFYKFGFHKIHRPEVPEIIMQTREFKDICPISAVVMHRKL